TGGGTVQGSARLATITTKLGEVRAEVPGRDGGSLGSQLTLDLLVDRVHLLFIDQATRDSRLIGDDDSQVSESLELDQCGSHPEQQAQCGRVAPVVRVVGQGSGAIEQRRLLGRRMEADGLAGVESRGGIVLLGRVSAGWVAVVSACAASAAGLGGS